MFKGMHKFTLAVGAAAALFVIPNSAFFPIYSDSDWPRMRPNRRRPWYGWPMRGIAACLEQGEGNCRRYRETCQRPVRRDVRRIEASFALTRTSWANKAKGMSEVSPNL
jgi:hypothetical protein